MIQARGWLGGQAGESARLGQQATALEGETNPTGNTAKGSSLSYRVLTTHPGKAQVTVAAYLSCGPAPVKSPLLGSHYGPQVWRDWLACLGHLPGREGSALESLGALQTLLVTLFLCLVRSAPSGCPFYQSGWASYAGETNSPKS